MKNILDIRPNPFKLILYELKEEDYIEDQERYNYFVEIFYRELDDFIDKAYSRRKEKSKTLEEKRKESVVGQSLGRDSNLKSDLSSFGSNKEREEIVFRIRAKYLKDFDAQRQRFHLYKGRFYTYSIRSLGRYTPIIFHEYEDDEILHHLNIYAYLRNRSFLRFIVDKLKG